MLSNRTANFIILLIAAIFVFAASSCNGKKKLPPENSPSLPPVTSPSPPVQRHPLITNWYKFRCDSRNTGFAGFAEGVSEPVLLWKFRGRHEFMSSPSVSGDGNIWAGSHDGNIYKISPAGKGSPLVKTAESVVSSPLIIHNLIAAGSMDGFLYVLTPSGKTIFKSDMEDWVCSSPSIMDNGNIIIAGRKGVLRCLSSEGKTLWEASIGTNEYEIQSSPAVYENRIYIGSENGNIYRINADGTITGTFEAGSAVYASPAVDESGNIYAGSSDGIFFCLDPRLKLKWKYKAGGGITSSAALHQNHIIFGCRDGSVYCLDTNGSLLWKYQTGKSIESSPAVDKHGRIYVGSDDCHLYAIDSGGKPVWKYRITGPILSSPALTQNRIVFGCEDKYVYCLGEKKPASKEKTESNRN